MTADFALYAFYDGVLSIDITHASAEDLTKLQEILGLKLIDGKDISSLVDYEIITENRFIHDNKFYYAGDISTNGINRLTICHRMYGRLRLTLSEFLSMFCSENIEENDFLEIFQ